MRSGRKSKEETGGPGQGGRGDWGCLVSHVPGKEEASGCGEEVGSIRFGEIREAEN